MATITTHQDQDVVEHRLRSVVPVLAAALMLLCFGMGFAWCANQAVDLLRWAVAAQ